MISLTSKELREKEHPTLVKLYELMLQCKTAEEQNVLLFSMMDALIGYSTHQQNPDAVFDLIIRYMKEMYEESRVGIGTKH